MRRTSGRPCLTTRKVVGGGPRIAVYVVMLMLSHLTRVSHEQAATAAWISGRPAAVRRRRRRLEIETNILRGL